MSLAWRAFCSLSSCKWEGGERRRECVSESEIECKKKGREERGEEEGGRKGE